MTHRIRYATPYSKVSALKLAKTTLNCCSVVSWDDEGIIRAQAKYGKIERSSWNSENCYDYDCDYYLIY